MWPQTEGLEGCDHTGTAATRGWEALEGTLPCLYLGFSPVTLISDLVCDSIGVCCFKAIYGILSSSYRK